MTAPESPLAHYDLTLSLTQESVSGSQPLSVLHGFATLPLEKGFFFLARSKGLCVVGISFPNSVSMYNHYIDPWNLARGQFPVQTLLPVTL